MEFPEGFNQLELLQTHGDLIPMATNSTWSEGEEEECEEEECERTEEWYEQEERRLQDTHTHTPAELMLWAAENNRLATVQRMLTVDSSLIGCRDTDGYTPLHRAAYAGHVGVACALIDAGAELEARTADDWTPLHCACRWDNVGVASCLLRCGASVNSQSRGGLTPLHLAAGSPGSGRSLELLLMQRPLLTETRNCSGDTAEAISHRTSKHHTLFQIAHTHNNTHTHTLSDHTNP
ncbi:ankyrin repeat domain-containing protein 49 [Clupea harengus]|uniref:Ankyrin repeat domain-containing protein 49 n=1 Tax=Clupea harengus TaxID=7950 RepID=A0A6P8FR00_CLUHA|nr:ankyrin repeat domain-containing protein 49 [Clupea harengus]